MPLLKTSFISKITLFLAAAMLSISAMATDFNQTQRLANQGNADAQFNLGEMYYLGDGVSQNYTTAKKWFEKAANQGDATAQFNLGFIYEYGHGVRQNYGTAKE
ncbi:tetratricopeptide repeat protein [Psychrobacter sp. ASPA161_9]|uniref:tetratricopeptide repeat protein n=1 Tax=Psychrobacter sp. ASPA161_9 TaxID=3160961 RepID=UPI003F81F34D